MLHNFVIAGSSGGADRDLANICSVDAPNDKADDFEHIEGWWSLGDGLGTPKLTKC